MSTLTRPFARSLTRASLPLPLMLFLAAAALRLIAFAVFYFGSVLMGRHGSVNPYDSVLYDRLAWTAAEHFRSGTWVDLRGSAYAASWDVGFTYLVAFEYTLAGHHPEVARIIDCLLAAVSAPAAYIAARQTRLGEKMSARAGWLVACWPLSLYWAGFDLLKDPLVWVFLAVGLVALTAASWPVRAVLGAIAAGGAYLSRIYMGPGVAVLLLLAGILRRDWKGLIATVAALAVVEVALLSTGFPTAWALNPFKSNGELVTTGPAPTTACGSVGGGSELQSLVGSECAVPLTFTPRALAVRIGVGVPIVLYGPGLKPLKSFQHPTLDWGMYPGLIVWTALIPFTLLGLWRALVRRDTKLWGIALFGLGIWGAMALIYAGHAVRQREMAFPATLILTSLGLERPWPKGWWRWAYAAYWLVVLAGLSWEAGFV